MLTRIPKPIVHVPSRSLLCNLRTIPRPAPHLIRYKPLPATSIHHCTTITTTPPDALPPKSYTPPSTGLLSHLPSRIIPYAELIRLDKPTGTLYLFIPCLWSTLLAATVATPAVPLPTLATTTSLFLAGALIMRGAGCTINDLWDRSIDRHVTRTRHRPLARGAISPRAAITFTAFQLLGGLGVLLQFPVEAVVCGVPSLLVVSVYPLMKRVTHYPQFVLGLAFSWGALLGFPALGLSLADPVVAATAACLYGSNVAWTMLYDTIYAHQDVKDDVKAGVKSIAVRHQGVAKALMGVLGAVQVGLLAGAGVVSGCGPVFYIAGCGGTAATLGYMIRKVDLGSVDDCWYYFKWCAWVVGLGAVGGGLAAEYAAVRCGIYGDEGWRGIGGHRNRGLEKLENGTSMGS